MTRDPAMHITLSNLVVILEQADIPNAEKTALHLMRLAIPFNIKDRYIVSGNAKVQKKAKKVIAVAKNASMTVERFNRILDACRREVGHRHITPVRKGDKNYLLLKEVAQMACEFAHSCGIESVDEGCKVYVMLGLQRMKYSNTYALGKFKYHDPYIYNLYESLDMVATDPKPNRTKKFHDCYQTLLLEYANIERDLKAPEDYVCFVYARLEADRAKADIEDWIRAQFEELQRAFDAIPSPNQLFSENALKRYYQYVRKVKKEEPEEVVSLKWETSKDTFENKYAEKLRLKNAY